METYLPNVWSKIRARCPICGRERYRVRYDLSEGRVVECRGCGLLMTYPQPPESETYGLYGQDRFCRQQDPEGPGFDQVTFEKCWIAGSRERLAELEQLVCPGRLLDVGAGTGVFLAEARSRGWQVEGLELNRWACEYAERHFCLKLQNLPFEASEFRSGSFDVVTLWHVLEHLRRPGDALRRCRGLLRPGGVLAVEVPNVASGPARRQGPRWRHLVPEQHLFHFSPETLTALAEGVGFSVALRKAVGGTDLLRKEPSLVPGWVKRQVGRHLEVFLPLQRVARRLYHHFCGGAQFVRLYARRP